MTSITFKDVGYNGKNVGTLSLSPGKVHWADAKGHSVEIDPSSVASSSWTQFGTGSRGHWRVVTSGEDASFYRFDGLKIEDFQKLEKFSKDNFSFTVNDEEIGSSGANYGEIDIQGKLLKMSAGPKTKTAMELPLGNLNSCVLAKDDVEIQFLEEESNDNRDDFNLAQITFHFPLGQEGEDIHGPATNFHKRIEEMNLIRSQVSGDTIVEFSKEQGNFITPRGKFALQMTTSSFVMKGAKYTFPIKYTNVNSFYLLNLPNGNFAFMIAMEKPIRQGQQKYQNLVMDIPAVTEEINLSLNEAQLLKYSALQESMEDELQNLVAKVFKSLSDKSVFIPKKFQTAAEQFSIKCVCKTNSGFLYPLTKAFVFIYKPALLVLFEDISHIEYINYSKNAKVAATRTFEIKIHIKDQKYGSYDQKDYHFTSIDRIEFPYINEYVESRGIVTKFDEAAKGGGSNDAYEEDGDDEKYEKGSDENSEEEDDDYNAPSESDDSVASDAESEESDEDTKKKSSKKRGGGGGGSEKKRSKK